MIASGTTLEPADTVAETNRPVPACNEPARSKEVTPGERRSRPVGQIAPPAAPCCSNRPPPITRACTRVDGGYRRHFAEHAATPESICLHRETARRARCHGCCWPAHGRSSIGQVQIPVLHDPTPTHHHHYVSALPLRGLSSTLSGAAARNLVFTNSQRSAASWTRPTLETSSAALATADYRRVPEYHVNSRRDA